MTGFSSGVLLGTPKDRWFPPPVKASRNDLLKALDKAYAGLFWAFRLSSSTFRRRRMFSDWSRDLPEHEYYGGHCGERRASLWPQWCLYLMLSVSPLTHVSRSDAARGTGMNSIAMTIFLASSCQSWSCHTHQDPGSGPISHPDEAASGERLRAR